MSVPFTRVIEHEHAHSHGHREVVSAPADHRWFTHTHEHQHPDPESTEVFVPTKVGGWHNAAQSHDATHWHELVEDSE